MEALLTVSYQIASLFLSSGSNSCLGRTFSPAVFTGQLPSRPLGRRMGWKSITALVKRGGQRDSGGRAVKQRVCSRSSVCHFGDRIVFSGGMCWISVGCHKKEGGAELFLMAAADKQFSGVQLQCTGGLRQVLQRKANLIDSWISHILPFLQDL